MKLATRLTWLAMCIDTLVGTWPFHSRANSLPGAKVPIALWPIRSLDLSLQGPFIAWNFRSRALSNWPRTEKVVNPLVTKRCSNCSGVSVAAQTAPPGIFLLFISSLVLGSECRSASTALLIHRQGADNASNA